MLERDSRWWAIYTALLAENWRVMVVRPVETPEALVSSMERAALTAAAYADLAFATALVHAQTNPLETAK